MDLDSLRMLEPLIDWQYNHFVFKMKGNEGIFSLQIKMADNNIIRVNKNFKMFIIYTKK